MYLQFLSFLHNDMTKVVGILPHVRQYSSISHSLYITAADDLATQGARASAAMILT